MFSSPEAVFKRLLLALGLVASLGAAAQSTAFPGVGRPATAKEVARWDIDVRPDFKGLPAGSGSVAKGQEIWEAKCAQCHGVFGESNEVFSPLVGGTTAQDVKTGRVANLAREDYPGRTTMMKVPTVSTLWDYINRAMPWNMPKSLSPDEVYAVTAYLLNLGNVVPDNFTLSDRNMAEAQARLPNRQGMSTAHALWPGQELGGLPKPDVTGSRCMRDCPGAITVTSTLPDFARNQHGNLAEQNRPVGPQRGADTSQPEARPGLAPPLPTVAKAALPEAKSALALAGKNACTACHGLAQKMVGPSFVDIGRKYPGQIDYLAAKIKSGGVGLWGPITMPAQTLSEADAKTIAIWLAAGAGR